MVLLKHYSCLDLQQLVFTELRFCTSSWENILRKLLKKSGCDPTIRFKRYGYLRLYSCLYLQQHLFTELRFCWLFRLLLHHLKAIMHQPQGKISSEKSSKTTPVHRVAILLALSRHYSCLTKTTPLHRVAIMHLLKGKSLEKLLEKSGRDLMVRSKDMALLRHFSCVDLLQQTFFTEFRFAPP
ncbi:hypothetical protein D5086_029438 [Populus alba]|uniref:Uncharacterized protein n=1 Tax=Populus alba TaxID=43335 RepID=A0ACC4ATI0_POPAL